MTVETFELAPGYLIPRLIRGGWQLAGDHGEVDPARAIGDMAQFVRAGIDTFDCADIYTGVEEMIGRFRARLLAERGAEALKAFKVHTKFVPDWDALARIDRSYVHEIIDRSLQRLKLERLDLVQFHWWNYAVPGAVETALFLKELQDEGKIRHIGVSNVELAHLEEARRIVDVVSVQNRFNADDRSSDEVLEACERDGIGFLPWKPLAGRRSPPEELADLLRRSPVMLPIPGTGSLEHLEENMTALDLI